MKEKVKEKRSNKSSAGCLGFLIIIALILFITNPDIDQYRDFIKNEIANDAASKIESEKDGWVVLLFYDTYETLTLSEVLSNTRVKNFYIFTLYNIENNGKSNVVIGIADHFFITD